MDLRDYLRALRRRWLIVVGCVVLALASATALVARETPMYSSTIRMFVSTPHAEEATAYQGGLFSQQRVISYADLVVGDLVASAVVDDLGLDISSSELASNLSSRVVPDTVLFDVTASSTSPETARDIADAAGRAFSLLVTELESSAAGVLPPIKVTTVDSADLATSPSSPLPVRALGLAGILGLLAGVGIALLREVLDVTVKDVDRLSERIGTPTLGVIGFDADARKSPLPVVTKPQAAHAEAFRQLRTNLQFVDIDKGTRTLVVTSSLPSEGKTRTSVNLALALAQAGQHVVLVEADLRRPRLNQYLGLVDDVGVTTVLLGRIELSDALQPYGDLPLEVLACGRQPPNPSELLSSERMQQLLGELRERFDVVVIDAPPLLPVTDAALLARQVDGAVLVVRHGKTTYDQVDRAAANLALAGGRLLGTVVNMAPARGHDSYAYNYSYARPDGGWRSRTSSGDRERREGSVDRPIGAEHSPAPPTNGKRVENLADSSPYPPHR